MEQDEDALLKECVGYDPVTGRLFWKMDRGTRGKAGNEVGSLNSEGYRVFNLMGKTYAAHRVAVFLHTGSWPKGEVDHRNHTRHDNRWKNLRDVSRSKNQRNRRTADKDSKTGFLGVTKRGNRFRASLTRSGKHIHLGYYSTAKQAHAAYVEARSSRSA